MITVTILLRIFVRLKIINIDIIQDILFLR